ncbi:hypothetical protein ACLFMI_23675 [Pseudonocardia nantongensis]|uniref:hypothetical protein n=1 Tax=Pseudonocardia nantongensis TaxID=1181885 RepID=UPI00397C9040
MRTRLTTEESQDEHGNKFSHPDEHHLLSDPSFCELDDPGVFLHAGGRPYGLIEATITRAGVDPAEAAWSGIAGFC